MANRHTRLDGAASPRSSAAALGGLPRRHLLPQLRHDVVLVYPVISGRNTDQETLRTLARFPQNGGTLIATNVLGGGLAPVFGFEGVTESRSHTHLTFDDDYAITADFQALGQKTIKIH